MHITCPGCAAVYDVPAILLSLPRTMRCATCAQDWQTAAIDPQASPPDAADTAADITADLPAPSPDHPAAPRRAAHLWALLHNPARLRATAPSLAGWVLSLGALFIAGQTTVEHRAGLVALWPPAHRLFLWLGLD